MTPEAARFMGQVFATLSVIYGNFWKTQFKNRAASQAGKDAWFRAFEEAGLKAADVKAALDYCKTSVPDLPNLPQFIGIARDLKRPIRRAPVLTKPKGTWAERQGRARREISKMRTLLGG